MKILEIYAETMELEEDVDLTAVAEATDGYTGADLRAILYSSQMIRGEEVFFLGVGRILNNIIVYFR